MAQFSFNSNSQGLDLTNALYFTQLFQLAYQPLNQIKIQFNLSQYQSFDVRDTDRDYFL